MNVGVIAPSNTNPYASALVARLVDQGDTPCCVIRAERSRARTLVDYLRVNGARATARRVLEHWGMAKPAGPDVRRYLQRHPPAERVLCGQANADWDPPLSRLCEQWGIDYIHVPGANAESAVQYVRWRSVDLLLNTGGEILSEGIIRSPGIGILNAHMASLPSFRGMNVLEWSLFEGESIGVTLHFIDDGIDTGEVVMFRELPVAPGDTVNSLRAKSIGLNIDLMAEGVSLLKAQPVRPHRQPQSAGKQYFVMHPRLRRLVEHKLRERWRGSAAPKPM